MSNQPAARIVFALAFILPLLAPGSSRADDLGKPIQQLADGLTSLKQGAVASATENEVYIALGQRDGIVPGNRFEIIRQGDALTMNGEVIGYKETHVADVEISKVREKVSIATYKEKAVLPAVEDQAYEVRKPIKRLAIAQFSYNQGFNRFTKSLQQKLFTMLVKKGLQVVERDQLERVLKEQKLGYSGLVNIDSAKKIGQLLGAEGMVLGTVSDMGDRITLNSRLVDMETGDTLAAAEASLPKTTLIDAMLKKPVTENAATVNAPGETQAPGPKKKKAKTVTTEIDNFTIELLECKKTASIVSCPMIITNNAGDRMMSLWGSYGTTLFDNFGNEYRASEVWLADCRRSDTCRKELIYGLPTRAGISFSGIAGGAERAAVLRIQFRGSKDYSFKLRDIPFTKE